MSKKNKSLIALLLVLCVGLIGLTIAYFLNSTSIENEFKTNPYGTTVEEEFTSPSNWLPGDTTDKIVTVTNSGQVDEAVRISLSETWTPNNANATLTGWIHADGTKSNHTTENELSTDVRAAIINFTNNSDWTKVGDYYYYNYRLAPGQTTDSLIESVTFNALTKLGDTCITSSENGIKTITCNSSGEDYDHATYKLTVNIETVQYNKFNEAWNLNNSVTIASMKPMNASQLALKSNPVSVTNYTDENIHEMYTFEHEATAQTPALTDYRYIGNDPYNYVYFNCDDLNNQTSETCEVWRILGVFDVERTDPNDANNTITETRMKLVRENFIKKDKWDETGKNDWTTSTLNLFLNGEYYSNTGESLANGYGLKELAREMIDNAIYYLGASNTTYGTPEYIYSWERGANLCGACGSDITKLKWEGKIAIMYPSDEYMIFKGGRCHDTPSDCRSFHAETGWIYNGNKLSTDNTQTSKWLLSPTIYYGRAFLVTEDDTLVNGRFVGGDGSIYDTGIRGIRPTLYLSSSVKIIDGDGSSSNPYWLGL